MSFNPKVIRDSFELAKPIGDQVVDKFYQILFQKYPAAKPLFANVDLQKQKSSLLGSLVYIVDNLESDQLAGYLKNMGSRHTYYGAEAEHYPLVGDALLSTFQFFFKEKWTHELQNEWSNAYGVISSLMLDGAAHAKAKKKAA